MGELVELPAADDAYYRALCERGTVTISGPPALLARWRRELRKRARADGRRIRTGLTDVAGHAWAFLPDVLERHGELYDAFSEAERSGDERAVARAEADLNAAGLESPRVIMARVDAPIRAARAEAGT